MENEFEFIKCTDCGAKIEKTETGFCETCEIINEKEAQDWTETMQTLSRE
jgi:hypothetical protein